LLIGFKVIAQERKIYRQQSPSIATGEDSVANNDDERGIDRDPFAYTRFSPGLPDIVLPIRPTRTIAFVTHEGTDMNVDISPDGKTLVFDLLGELFTVPAAGGNAMQLTRGLAINGRPVWSPDGEKIAYISDYSGALHLNVRNISGAFHGIFGISDRQLLINYDEALWTADSKFVHINDYTYDFSGNATPQNIKHPIAFSKDGQFTFYINADSAALYRFDLITHTQTKFFAVPHNIGNPKVSPDLRWFAFITDSNSKRCLIVRDITSKKERILAPSLLFTVPVNDLVGFPNLQYNFSPDSKNIFIGYGGKIHRITLADASDQIIPFTANVKIDVGSFDYNTFQVNHHQIRVKYTRSAVASPDGKHLVFSALDRLYIMDMPNGKPHLLCPQSINQFQPAWSADSQWIAYVSWSDTSGGLLWRVRASGGKPEQLTRIPGLYQRPAWSPDGEFIAATKGGPKIWSMDANPIGELDVVTIKSGKVKVIDDTVPLWNEVAFSEDGKKLIYEPNETEMNINLKARLVSKSLDGNEVNVIAAGSDMNPVFIKERMISPDGRFISYSLGEDLFLVPVNKAVSPTIIYDEKQQLPIFRFARGLDPHWDMGGKILSWSYGNQYYRINPDHIMEAAEKRKESGLLDSAFVTVFVKPDQVIPLNITVPASYAHGRLAIRNVRIITMQGDKVIPRGTILINNGRFVAVGATGDLAIPKGTKVLDLQGTTIMPGFVDLHLHMIKPPDVSPQQNWMYLVNLAYGVTTARDPRTNIDAFGYKELLASGQMIGPRYFPSGRSVTEFEGGMDDIPRVGNLADAMAIVQKRKKLGGTFIKQYLLSTRLQRQWLLIASRQNKMNMTNEGDFSPVGDIGMMKDGSPGVEHNPVWDDVYNDMVTLFARSGTYFTPTDQVHKGNGADGLLYFNYKFWQHPPEKLIHFMAEKELRSIVDTKHYVGDTINPDFLHLSIVDARVRKAGGMVTLGSHGNNQGVGVHNELWALQMGGLTNIQALQAATIMGARAIGIQKDVGSIEVGKIADLIVLNKNPLDNIHNSREIRYVMKDGILYNADNLDEIWPVYKKCPEWRLKTKYTTNTKNQ